MRISFEQFTQLQYRCKHAEQKVRALESGDAYRRLKKGKERQRKYYERQIAKKDKEIEALHIRIRSVIDMWFRVFEDVQAECEKRLREKDRIISQKNEQLRKKAATIESLKKTVTEKTREIIEERAKVNEEKEINQKLTAQVNENFQNSSTPSSQDPFRGKIPNNREKTGRRMGGQPGHEGHGQKLLEPTKDPVFIEAPPEIKNNPDYYLQSGPNSIVRKQVVGLRIMLDVTEYWAYVYRNRRTGAKYHAPFPKGVTLKVNYDDSIKSLIFLLRNHANVSVENTRELLEMLTEGKLQVSHGMVCGINKEYAGKTEAELNEIFSRLTSAKVMYTDMTTVRHNGKLKNVVICTDKENTFYAFRDYKGDKGLKGTPVEYFLNLLVHDHDKTYYHYGSRHQECNVHHTRYLRGAQENEADLKWHKQMLDLLLEMNKTRNRQNRILDDAQIKDFRKRYDAILYTAKQEYYDNPPSRYYRKGYNLYKEFEDFKESVLCFLTDPDVDFSNNVSERDARKIKRHSATAGSFRGDSNKSGEAYCKAMSVLQTDRKKGKNVYETTKVYFRRQKPMKLPGKRGEKARVST